MKGSGSNMVNKICPHCKQLMNVYRRSIRKGMVPGLLALSSGTSKKTSELGLSAGPRSDFTTLRYWGLICKDREEGNWMLTTRGHLFIKGQLPIAKYVFIYNSEVQGRSDELVYIQDIDEKIFDKKEFDDHITPMGEFDIESNEKGGKKWKY